MYYHVVSVGQLNLNTPDARGPIRNSDARRVCSLSGIAAERERVISLRKLRDGLDRSLRELDGERRKEQILNKALLVARFTKASCDAFLGMAATLAKALLPEAVGNTAEIVENLYGTVTPIAEATSVSLSGGEADWVQKLAASVKKGVPLVTDQKGYQLFTVSTAVKVEIVKSAMNQDPKALLRSAVSYLYDLHTTLGEMAGARKTAAFLKIAKNAFEYNEQIGKAFDEMLQGSFETEERYRACKTTISNQAKRLSMTIAELEKFIMSCEIELRDRIPTPKQTNKLKTS